MTSQVGDRGRIAEGLRRHPDGTPTALEVESSFTSPTGIVVATYRVLRP